MRNCDSCGRVLSPVFRRTTGRHRRGDENQLALGLRQPLHELSAVAKARQNHDLRRHILSASARAVADHGALERANARRDQVDVRVAATPAAPRAILFVLRVDPPRLVHLHQPVLRRLEIRRAHESGPERVEERLRQLIGVRTIHPERPNPFDGRVVGGKGLRGREARRADERDAENKAGECAHSLSGSRERSAMTYGGYRVWPP